MINEAYKIAQSDLFSNYGKLGIYAGPKKHRQYWARDSFIASFGACANGDLDQVRKNLDLFIMYQRIDGHIPARVEENYHHLTVLGINIKRKLPQALHRQSQPWAGEVVDSNSWFLISVMNYLKISKNEKWYIQNKDSIIKAAKWLLDKIRNNGLLYERYTANWSDCSLRKGYLLYNNVLAWKALYDSGFESEAGKLKESIITNFWDGKLGYLIDRIDNGKKYNYFYSDGNILAIWFGLVDTNKARIILNFVDKCRLNDNPISTGYPKLDNWNDLINKIFFPMYKTEFTFTWLGCFLALAEYKTGMFNRGKNTLLKVADKIVEYNTCHEVLFPDGKPVKYWFYKSEPKIAWTAGMYIYAYNTILK